MLDPENPQVFWGFGAVMSGRGKLPQAIEYLETAREHWSGGEGVVPLLADLGTLRSAYAASLPADRELERAQAFISANQSFAESLELNPNYARSWREWALSLYDQGRFSEAWLKAGRAQDLKADPFPADFLSKLKQKVGESK